MSELKQRRGADPTAAAATEDVPIGVSAAVDDPTAVALPEPVVDDKVSGEKAASAASEPTDSTDSVLVETVLVPANPLAASLAHSVRKTPLNPQLRGINIAPLNTPLQLRLETAAIVWHAITIPFFICLFLLLLLLGVVMWACVILPYLIWWYGFDLHTPTNGKAVYRVKNWIRNLILWQYFTNYYPIRVYKKCDLEPTFTEVSAADADAATDDEDEEDLILPKALTTLDKIFKVLGLKKRINELEKRREVTKVQTGPRYIFGYHPHGVISMGAFALFGTNVLRNEPWRPPAFLQWLFHDTRSGERLFPGIGNIFPLTLTTQFTIPFYRDYLLALGLTLALAKNIKSLINNGDNLVCIVVGGARELLLNLMVSQHTKVGKGYTGPEPGDDEPSKQREIKLVLNNRKGFVKLAIELGNVCLVPTFAFGEVDIYKITKPQKNLWGYLFQQWLKLNFQFTLPFFSARGVFIYDFGFLPYRNPINICTGEPIKIPPNALQDWRAQHPEEAEIERQQEEAEKQEELKPEAVKRTASFSLLFKVGQLKPKRSLVKAKIPAELLDHYHQLYVKELERVYEANKHRFGYGDVQLVIQ